MTKYKRKLALIFNLIKRWREVHDTCPECIPQTDIDTMESISNDLFALKILSNRIKIEKINGINYIRADNSNIDSPAEQMNLEIIKDILEGFNNEE